MSVTRGSVERACIRTLAEPSKLQPIPADEQDDLDSTPVVSTHKSNVGSVKEVQAQLRGQSDAKVRSRAVSIRRAFRNLLEKGLVETAETDERGTVNRIDTDNRRQYYRLTDAGIAEANRLYRAYTEDLADLRQRYGGDWSAL